ncbi:MAG: signal recognition particle protein [Candidatus Aenigmarchaeota archaeon]|nr:signal recognition particle protein [Candidatus Aenigmarchaeota archaeon]
MLNSLSKGLGNLIRKLITGTTIDKVAVEETLRDMETILLQSDVDVNLTGELLANIRKKCLDEKIPPGLTLREHVLKVIYEELIRLLGEKPVGLLGKRKIMLVGLFGSGKTTTAGKLGKYFLKQGLKPVFIGLDYHRPAAADQIMQIGKQIGIPAYVEDNKDPYSTAKNALEKFAKNDVLIFDTAGRNALDIELADELKKLGEIIKPDEVVLVIPADLGKVAKQQSEEFHKLVGITGVIITKMDGTAKAGGALAATSTTGAKVKFIGVGEKIEDLELYDPTRFVSRLLGLGDLQTLLEKAKEVEIKKESVEKIAEGKFTLQDFYEQIEAMGKMGPLSQIANMIPGMGMMKLPEGMLEKQEGKLKSFKIIIQSMTKEEREYPEIINNKRIARIAKGSGRSEADVRELLTQYNQMKKLFKSMGGMKGLQRGALKNISKQFGFKF